MSNFPPLEVVGRGRETQFQVDENLNYSTRLIHAPCFSVSLAVSCCYRNHFDRKGEDKDLGYLIYHLKG